jgi:hypothetical protein
METYIIPIYRRLADRPEQIIGVSEQVETGKKSKFKSFQQLGNILLNSESNINQPKKNATNKNLSQD